jgi:hypothetical protein
MPKCELEVHSCNECKFADQDSDKYPCRSCIHVMEQDCYFVSKE